MASMLWRERETCIVYKIHEVTLSLSVYFPDETVIYCKSNEPALFGGGSGA